MTKTELRQIAKDTRVSDFNDYRDYLAAVYHEAKHRDRNYSFSKYSADLHLGSSNAHSIIYGKRSFTEKAALKVCEALRLTGTQKRYLLALVRQARAKGVAEREEAFATRMELREKTLPTDLERSQLRFFESWYHAAILELLRLDASEDDPVWISERIRPSVSVPDVRKSLELLQDLGYVDHDEERCRLYPTSARISTGNEVANLAIASFHRQMINLASNAMDIFAPDVRDISALTVAVSDQNRQRIKDEIIGLRKKIMGIAAEDQDKEGLVQINFQLFPLTDPEKEPK